MRLEKGTKVVKDNHHSYTFYFLYRHFTVGHKYKPKWKSKILFGFSGVKYDKLFWWVVGR